MKQGWIARPCAKCNLPMVMPIAEFNKSPYCKACQEDIQAEQPIITKKRVKVRRIVKK